MTLTARCPTSGPDLTLTSALSDSELTFTQSLQTIYLVRPVVLRWGSSCPQETSVAMSGDIFGSYDGGGVVGRGRDASKYSTGHRPAPCPEERPSPKCQGRFGGTTLVGQEQRR